MQKTKNEISFSIDGMTRMTSREIANLTSKIHKNVLQDVRGMFAELGIDGLNYQRIYLDSLNRQQTAKRKVKTDTQTKTPSVGADGV